jgi:hypothetical protein
MNEPSHPTGISSEKELYIVLKKNYDKEMGLPRVAPRGNVVVVVLCLNRAYGSTFQFQQLVHSKSSTLSNPQEIRKKCDTLPSSIILFDNFLCPVTPVLRLAFLERHACPTTC